MKAMLLAAGRGERLRPLTDRMPKPMVPVLGKPLIEHAIERLVQAGVEELVVNLGYRGEQLREALGEGARWSVRIHYSEEGDPPLETGGGIFRALPLLGEGPFLVINSDVYSDIDLEHLVGSADQTLSRDLAHLVMVRNPAHRPGGDFVLDRGRIRLDGEPRYTFSGVSLMRAALFCNCEPGRFPLAPLLRHAAACEQLGGRLHEGAWSDVGTPERLAELEAALS